MRCSTVYLELDPVLDYEECLKTDVTGAFEQVVQ